MEFFCVLMSFVFVYAVEDSSKEEYAKQLFITNEFIQQAADDTDKIIGNALEVVIIDTVFQYGHEMEILNNMFATPELADLEINSEKFINIQKAIQSAIDEIIPVILPETSNIDFVTMDLVQLGNKRRHFTRNALRKIIIRILIGKEPGINLDGTCCLIGLFMSTKYPVFHTTTTKTGDRSTCTLTKQNDSNTVYRSFNGEFFEVDPGNVDIRKNYLVLQLL